MSRTQLFMEYFEKIKDPILINEFNKEAAQFIAHWLSFRWKCYKNGSFSLYALCKKLARKENN